MSSFKLYAICSEPQSEADLAMDEWKLFNFTSVVGDQENKIAAFLKEHYLATLHITDCTRTLSEATDPYLTVKRYPNGAVQPALLFFVDQKLAISWASHPKVTNLQGALGRPDPSEVWKVVKHCYQRSEEGKEFQHDTGENLPLTVTFGHAVKLCCCSIL